MVDSPWLGERERREATLEAELNEVAGGLNVLHGRLVDIAAQCEAEPGLWRGVGIRSLEHWLCWRSGLTTHVARQVTSIARRADELPVSIAWLKEGRLSLGQVAEIARWAPWWADEQAAGLAEVMTVPQIAPVEGHALRPLPHSRRGGERYRRARRARLS